MTALFKRTGGEDFPDLLKTLISGPPKSGKGLAHGTPVLTPKGWRNIEDLALGDEVQGVAGPTVITGVYPQGTRPLFEVLLDDGGRVVCDDSHQWTVHPHGLSSRTVDVTTLMASVAANKRYGYLPLPQPIEGSAHSLPIPAYILGLLLGDGGMTSGSVCFHKPDIQLHEVLGAEYSLGPWDPANATLRIHGLLPVIRELGLAVRSLDKHIPETYLNATVADRFALLQGLLDTDGGMNGKATCFYTSSSRLRDDVVDLVRSLGGVAVVRTKSSPRYAYKGESLVGHEAYNISVRLPEQFGCPFRLERKVAAWHNGTAKRPPTRRVISVIPVGTGESTCIKVAAPDGLFVTEDYIVTHNTTLLGTVPNIVIADTEPYANNLQSVAHLNLPYVTIKGTDDLQRLLFVLRDPALRQKAAEQLGMAKIEAVGVDTIDTLQQIMKVERMRELKQSQFLRDDWAWLKDEMEQILRAFTALPLHVFFVVHTKTSEIGKGDDARQIVLPGLQGSIAESVAGMVGYSLLSFRKQELRPDGSPYTKYWLRAEGDETYNYLGNRAAGRLPDIIEPNFGALLAAAVAGRAAITTPVQPVVTPEVDAVAAAQIQNPAPVGTPAGAPEVAQSSGQQIPAESATVPPSPPAAPVDGGEPVNAAALSHVKKVYDAIGLEFPEATITQLTLGEARTLVRMWQAIQRDSIEGKGTRAPAEEMQEFLSKSEWLSDADKARIDAGAASGQATPPPPPAAPAAVVADPTGTIEQVMAYVTDDLVRIQEVFDQETARAKPRQTLVNALVNKGAKVQTPVQTSAPAVEPPAAPSAPTGVTPSAPSAEATATEARTEAEASQLLQGALGAVPIGEDGKPAPCEECTGEIDDEDIATLSASRFGRRLCVADYIAETKKPRAA